MRVYNCVFNVVSQTTGPTELALLANGLTELVRLRRWSASVTTSPLPPAQQIQFILNQLPSGYTAGSGGATGSIAQHDLGDSAAKATVVVGNTTPSTSTGLESLNSQGMYIYQGLDQVSFEPIPIVSGEAFSLVVDATVGVQNITGYVEWEEMGI